MSDADPPSTLGEHLRRLRTGRGLKMATVIADLGVPKATAYWWESPKGRPEPSELDRLLDFYDATPDARALAWKLRAARASSSPQVGLEDRPTEPDLTPVP